MSGVIDYRVEECSTPHALQQSVKQLLQEGWEPQGPVSVAYKRTVGFSTPVMAYCQALVRRSNNALAADPKPRRSVKIVPATEG